MPIESPYPPVNVSDVDLWSYLFDNPEREYPDDHVLFVDVASGKKWTYNSLRDTAEQFGKGLQAKWNLQKGDIVATMTPNTVDVIPVIFGTILVGGIICPLSFTYTVDELATSLRQSKGKALVTNVACLGVALQAASKVGMPLDHVLLVGQCSGKEKVKHFSSLQNASGAIRKVATNPREDLAYLVYSSGTTGLPKGVMLTHHNMVANAAQMKAAEVSSSDALDWKTDKSIGFLPMYHIYGVAVLIHLPIFRGITTHIMQSFDLPKFCATIQSQKITFAYIVPPVALALAKVPIVDQFDLSSLRYMHSSAAPAPKEVITAVYERLKVPIRQGYGLSEAAPGVANQRIETWNQPIGCSGQLVASMSARFVVDGKEVKHGEEGEVCLKGPNIFKGYYNNAKATAEAFDAEGWYHTGDIGRVDEQGNMYITDRLKELIKYNGFQVAPAQLEDLLLGHPAVADAAVIPVNNKSKTTELPRAYVVVAGGRKADAQLEKELHAWFNAKVSPHKKLRGGIRFVEAVPKSNAGKILRRVLVEEARREERGREKAKL